MANFHTIVNEKSMVQHSIDALIRNKQSAAYFLNGEKLIFKSLDEAKQWVFLQVWKDLFMNDPMKSVVATMNWNQFTYNQLNKFATIVPTSTDLKIPKWWEENSWWVKLALQLLMTVAL